ncbi:hypothetical protein GXM_10033 [Nostoc sphaeroides CCNUC1]|uniref:Uncharacterized protein n=1 Tax=Nostoc sphaeroides CCNUC1 TaxID=2653204 RepID=A0A5P8WLK2_9NOSO|nr:hypothetical protein GXM_10033 [Nostoc sphaeroides CCNUC1]
MNLLSFVITDDEAMSTTGYANAPAGKLGDRLIRMYLSPQNEKYTRILTNDT